MISPHTGRQFVQREANADNVTSFLESVMTDDALRRELQAGLLEASSLLGQGGAAERAAGAIAELLEE